MAKNRAEKFVENTTEKEELNAKIAVLENKVANLQYELNKKVCIILETLFLRVLKQYPILGTRQLQQCNSRKHRKTLDKSMSNVKQSTRRRKTSAQIIRRQMPKTRIRL